MSDHVYAQDEIFAAVRLLLKNTMPSVRSCSALMHGKKRMPLPTLTSSWLAEANSTLPTFSA